MKKFKRSERIKNTKDEIGIIRVSVFLTQKENRAVKGNIVRALSVKNACVSEVLAAIEKILF